MATRIARLRKKFIAPDDKFGKAAALKIVTDAGIKIEQDIFIIIQTRTYLSLPKEVQDAVWYLQNELDYTLTT